MFFPINSGRESRMMTLTRKIPGKSRLRLERGVLSVESGPDKGMTTDLEEGVLTLGKDENSTLCLTDPTVSRSHAEISHTSEGFLLQDLGSTNGTFLDGVRVDRAYLKDGVTITVGETGIRFKLQSETLVPKATSKTHWGEMVGESKAMREAFSLLERLAVSDVTVLVDGETGTGKELAARALHSHGPRSGKPFTVFDCSTVPFELMESELFGYQKGAFTGADEARSGAVEQAEGGTLFLDEIGELPLPLQAKLLRLLDRREYKRLGSGTHQNSDVRFVAATNRDLETLVKDGSFRQDLFFRVSAARVKLTPLCERPEDIKSLSKHFLKELEDRSGNQIKLDKAAMDLLTDHSWPGNARELKNVLETAAALCEGGAIGPDDLPALSSASDPAAEEMGSIRDAEARAISEALEKAGGNKRKAARLLGIAPSTLYAKMKQYVI
jgi:DNA-binding NtrC family response regulator